MTTTQELLERLPTYRVERLEPLVVMTSFHDAAQALLAETSVEHLECFNDAQRTAGYLIDELRHSNPSQSDKVTNDILRVSGEVFRHLEGDEILGKKPSEDEKEAFYRWAICTRHLAESVKKLAA